MRLRRADRRLLAGAVVAAIGQLAGAGAHAQRATSTELRPALVLQPRLNASFGFSDNFDQRAILPESDLVSRITAGFSLTGQRGGFKGNLDYALTGLNYARHSERNTFQNALNARFSLDLLDDRLTLLSEAQIDRSAISAFGVQPGTTGDGNANVTELRSLRLAPQWRAPLGRDLRYTAQAATALTQASNSNVGDRTQNSATLRIEPIERSRLGWSAEASHVTSDYKASRTYRTDRALANGSLSVDLLDLKLTASVGHERSNLTSVNAVGGTTWGAGFVWEPSSRTRLSFNRESRIVGQTHDLRFEYRLPRTVFTLFSGRSLSTDQQPSGSQLQGLIERDPLLRAAVLQRFFPGADPTAPVNLGFLQSAATIQTQHGLSMAWTGPRQTLVVNVLQGQTQRLDPLGTLLGDLLLTQRVRQSGVNLNLGHRLTPQSQLALVASLQQSDGGPATLQSRQRHGELQFSTRLTPENALQLAARRSLMDTGAAPVFAENSLSVSLGMRF